MNLVHKVGVIFHAQERVSRHLEKMAKGMFGLEKHYGKVNSLQAQMQAREAQVAKASSQHMAARETAIRKYETSLGRMGKTQTKLSEMERKNQRAGQVLWDQYYAKIAGAETARTALQVKQQADREAANARHLARMTTMDEVYEANRAKAVLASNKIIDGYTKQQVANTAQRGKLLRGVYGTSDPTRLAGRTGVLSRGELSASAARQQNLRTLIAEQRSAAHTAGEAALLTDTGRNRQVRDPQTGQLRDLNAVEQGRAKAAAMRPYSRAAGELEKQLAAEQKRVEAHHQLVALQQKEVTLGNKLLAETTRQAAMLAAMDAEHLAAIEAISVAQMAAHSQLMAAQRAEATARERNDQLEIERTGQILAEKIRQHELIEQMKRDEMALQQTAHARMLSQIASEDAARVRAFATEKKLDDANRNMLRRKANSLGYNARDTFYASEPALNDMVDRHGAIQSKTRTLVQNAGTFAASRMASSSANIMGGGMTLAMLGYLGNHAIHPSVEFDQLKDAIALNIYGQKSDASGKLWSNTMFDTASGAEGKIPGTSYRMSQLEMLEILKEQLSAEIKPAEAVKNMPIIAKTLRSFQMKGVSTKGMSGNLATIFERAGAMNEEETAAIATALTKSANISGRATPKNIMDILLKSSIPMRSLGMDTAEIVKSFRGFDYMLAATPQGANVATQTAGFLEALARGGTNETASSALMEASKKYGLWKMTPGKIARNQKTGKPLKNSKGQQVWLQRPVPIFPEGSDVMDIYLSVTKAARMMSGVNEKRFQENKMSQTESAAYTQALINFVGAKFGGRSLMQIGNIKEQERYKVAVDKTAATPGLDATLGSMQNRYGKELLELKASWEDFSVTFGKALQGPMSGFLKDARWWLDHANSFLKTDNGKKMLELSISGIKWAATIALINGAFLGIPGSIVHSISQGIVSGIAAALTTQIVAAAIAGPMARMLSIAILSPTVSAAAVNVFAATWASSAAAPAVTAAATGGLAGVFTRALAVGGPVALAIGVGLATAFAAYKFHEALLDDAKATSDLKAGEDRSNAARASAAVARGENPAALGIIRTPNANFPAPGGKIFDGKTFNLPKQSGSSVAPNFDSGLTPTMTAKNNGPQTISHVHTVNVRVTGDGVSAEKAAKQIAPILTQQVVRAYQGGGKNVTPGTTPVAR